MRVSVFGLGYVGAVSGACLARLGHHVVGVDTDVEKTRYIQEGRSPIVEEGLEELICKMAKAGRLKATSDCWAAVLDTELSLICVGTPSSPNGSLRTDYVERVCAEVGQAIRDKGAYHSVVIRSTVLPGTTEKIVIPILEANAGGKAGQAFGISMHPEFLREGTSIRDFYDPPFTVIGTQTTEEFERICRLYEAGSGEQVQGKRLQCSVPTAEAIKYGCNVFHALKITFANEMGMFCKRAGVDAREVMSVLCEDTKLNISAKYMQPGFAFGGSCLPKDLRACIDYTRKRDVHLPMFEAAMASNRLQIERVADRISAYGHRDVSLMGISFKEATDDLRESPLVWLAEMLIGRGYNLRIFDPNVKYASLYGSNKQFIDKQLPHLKSLLVDADGAVGHGRVLVFGHNASMYRDLVNRIRADQVVLDLANVIPSRTLAGTYDGIYW